MLGPSALQTCCVAPLMKCKRLSAGDTPATQMAPDGEVVKAASKKIAIRVPDAGEYLLRAIAMTRYCCDTSGHLA